MTSGVCSKNKEKKAKRKKKMLKKIDQLGEKKYKETESSVAGSRTRFTCTCKKLLHHSNTHDLEINFVISRQFFSAIDAV